MSEVIRFSGRGVVGGFAEGVALVSNRPLSFFGEVDPNTGNIISCGSEIRGKCVADRVLIFPRGRGSTVGSYVIYRLAKAGLAPCAIINTLSEPIVGGWLSPGAASYSTAPMSTVPPTIRTAPGPR